MSILAMFKLVPRWMWLGLVVGACATGWMSSYRWHHRYDVLVNKQQADVLQAQAAASQATQANATTTAQLDTKYYKEFQNASKTADYWRARAQSERVPNQANCAANDTAHSTSSGVGNDTPPPQSTIDRLTCQALRLSSCPQ